MLALAPALGVTRLANITGLDCIGIPVVVACRPNSCGLATAQGKGVDLTAAKVSALMEAAERQQAEHLGLPRRLASSIDLSSGARVIDVARLPKSPGPSFDERRPLLWVPGVDLLQPEGNPTWVPYEVVHTDWSVPSQPSTGSLASSANGLASGNHVVEAAVHGLCEVIERDAVSVLGFGGESAVDARRVDLSTIDDPVCLDLLQRFERAGVNVAVWDATSDVAVAAFIALVVNEDAYDPRSLYAARGSGCHPARAVALVRALTEAAQSRLSFIAGSRDDMLRVEYDHVASPELADRTRVVMAKPQPWSFANAPTHEAASVEADLEHVLASLRHAGFDSAVVVDLRQPEYAIPVVRMLVPGLEGDAEEGAVPGRRARQALFDGLAARS
jgi:YcaO-like protein with predicted kinase domain